MSGDLVHDRAEIRNSADDDADRLVRRVFAALNSGRDAAVVQVVLDETDRLRRDVERWKEVAAEFEASYIHFHEAHAKARAKLDRLTSATDAELARRLEWAVVGNGRTNLYKIRAEGLDIISVTPEDES